MRQPTTHARARCAALALLGLLAAPPAFSQATPPAPAQAPPAQANGPGPATQPPPAPGTTTPAPTQSAPQTPGAAPATPPPNYNLQYTGIFDGYYLFQFTNPRFSNPAFANNNLGEAPYPEIRHNAPTLALGELTLYQNPRPNGFGYKATLIAGDDADLNHFGSLVVGSSPAVPGVGEGRFKNLMQLYGTYAFGGDGSGVDFGKFYTPFAYETTENNGDYNYTRSLPYLLTPTYHTGARIYAANALGAKGLTATFYLVKALFNTGVAGVQDDNKQPAFIGQLNYADPRGKFSLISELGLGKDKLGGYVGEFPALALSTYPTSNPNPTTNTRSTLTDNNFTYNFSARTLAALDYTYLHQEPNGLPKATTNGLGVYFRQQLTTKTAFALRGSGYDVHIENATEDFRPYELTATYEYKAAPNFTTRLEYRHDNANTKGAQVFAGGDGSPTKSNQDSVVIGEFFTF